MKKILLPIEDTPRSLKAIDFIVKHYTPEEAELVLMMVDESQTYIHTKDVEAAIIRKLETRLASIAAALRGFKLTTRAATGKAGIRISRAVRETGADLIVMTKSSKDDMLNNIGSTTEYVLNNAGCHVLIVNENSQTNEEYRGLVYRTASANVNLRGQIGNKQSECLLPSVNVDCVYHFDVTVGKIRFMHTAYNPDTRRWDLPPAPGQEVTLDIVAGESVDIFVKADSNGGKADRIRVVNRDMKKEAVFTYAIYAAPAEKAPELDPFI